MTARHARGWTSVIGPPVVRALRRGGRTRVPAVMLLAALLAGCGFQLRGTEVLPPDLGALHVSAPNVLLRETEVFLEGSNTRLVPGHDGADVVLTMGNERYDRRVLSVDPSTGKEREFQLAYSVDVRAVTRDGRTLIAPQVVTLQRDFVFERDALLGASREETVLREEMRRDAVQQILYRLRAAAHG
jgi:LPS-assembly lipoprotein